MLEVGKHFFSQSSDETFFYEAYEIIDSGILFDFFHPDPF